MASRRKNYINLEDEDNRYNRRKVKKTVLKNEDSDK